MSNLVLPQRVPPKKLSGKSQEDLKLGQYRKNLSKVNDECDGSVLKAQSSIKEGAIAIIWVSCWAKCGQS